MDLSVSLTLRKHLYISISSKTVFVKNDLKNLYEGKEAHFVESTRMLSEIAPPVDFG